MDQYEILEQIGKGSFGSAILVRHKHERKKYVLKKIRLARQTARCRRSAHQEMDLISKCQNQFIVEYKDSWVEKGCYVCIIIGYCEGGDMAEAIKKVKGVHFPEERLCMWLVQLLMALDYLHVRHILHRDVKCSNIFLTKDQDLRLGDFGLAKMLTSDELACSVVGTPTYMCPELLSDIPYGSKSDIWSLGCCIYEMTALKPAFKAFDMQGLINKINKSTVAPLPTMYSGAFRGLIRSMLRKNPELRPSVYSIAHTTFIFISEAADLLRHPHLQPYVIEIHLKSSSPRHDALMPQDSESTQMTSTSYSELPDIPLWIDREKRCSVNSDRIFNPSISGVEEEYICCNRTLEFPTNMNLSVASTHNTVVIKPMAVKGANVAKTPKSIKAAATCRKQTEPSKMVHACPSYELPVRLTRKSSPPLSMRARKVESPYKSSVSLRHCMSSPDVSVNAPRIDRVAEFQLSSSEDHLLPSRKLSLSPSPTLTPTPTPTKCSTSPHCGDRSITKDRCTVQTQKKAFSRPTISNAKHGIQNHTCSMDGEDGSEYSNKKSIAGLSKWGSSDKRKRQFDNSAYRHRAEALEGLLEFSAHLLLQERFEELKVLLKPFGPEKVSSRETAIWLTKSFKETAVK